MKPDYIMVNGSTIRLMEDAIEEQKRFDEIFSPEGLSKLFGLPPLPQRPQ